MKVSVPGASDKLAERLSTQFSPWASSPVEAVKETKVWHKGSLEDEDDAQTLNTRTAHRNRVIPHLTMKTPHNM